MVLISDIDDRTNRDEGTVDLRDLAVETQGAYLRQQEELHRLVTRTLDANVYLLSARAQKVLDDMGNLTLGLHDIDGTHATVGGHRLLEQSVAGLKATEQTGMEHIAVTGRHEWQAREVMLNHPYGKPVFRQWLIEQGFYRINERGVTELFEGTDEIANNVLAVREYFDPLLREMAQTHNVSFETTSLRGEGDVAYPAAHRTMYSVDVLRRGQKIDQNETELHQRVMTDFGERWKQRDPENALATLRTSSTGTIEFTPDGVNKAGAVLALLNELNVNPELAAYFGDSSNDLPVFENIYDLGGKFAIVNHHTSDRLLSHADIATVGINAGPLLQRIASARRAAKELFA